MKKLLKKIAVLSVCLCVCITALPVIPVEAASKPGKAAISTCVSKNAGQVTMKWKKVSKATGYQILLATNSKMTSNKKSVKTKEIKKTVTGLKAGKKYYAKVRAYRKSGSKIYYGSWSSSKTVTIIKADHVHKYTVVKKENVEEKKHQKTGTEERFNYMLTCPVCTYCHYPYETEMFLHHGEDMDELSHEVPYGVDCIGTEKLTNGIVNYESSYGWIEFVKDNRNVCLRCGYMQKNSSKELSDDFKEHIEKCQSGYRYYEGIIIDTIQHKKGDKCWVIDQKAGIKTTYKCSCGKTVTKFVEK